ncbi:MAG: NAD(P)-binding domain-containing protein [Rhodobacteraceae bacterium]|nr:NAD(P)-binding domain-containing protein [Paracoccaceae bacterium]
MKIGFIGTGVITEAIVRGLIAHRDSEEQIILSERSRDISARLAALSPRVRIESNNQRIVDQSDLVFLAVLPHLASDIIGPLNFREGQTVASLIASVPHEQLRSWTGGGVEIVRAIPLPAVAEGRGTTVLFPDNQYLAGLFGVVPRGVV